MPFVQETLGVWNLILEMSFMGFVIEVTLSGLMFLKYVELGMDSFDFNL